MKLAERGTCIGSGKEKLWVREIRKLTKNEHQTSIISSAYSLSNPVSATLMFARWCQENFFNYMMQHYAIDVLGDYSKKEVPDTEMVISSAWRKLEKKINSLTGQLKNNKSRFADLTLHPAKENCEKTYNQWLKTKTEIAEEIKVLETEIENLKNERKTRKNI